MPQKVEHKINESVEVTFFHKADNHFFGQVQAVQIFQCFSISGCQLEFQQTLNRYLLHKKLALSTVR